MSMSMQANPEQLFQNLQLGSSKKEVDGSNVIGNLEELELDDDGVDASQVQHQQTSHVLTRKEKKKKAAIKNSSTAHFVNQGMSMGAQNEPFGDKNEQMEGQQ